MKNANLSFKKFKQKLKRITRKKKRKLNKKKKLERKANLSNLNLFHSN